MTPPCTAVQPRPAVEAAEPTTHNRAQRVAPLVLDWFVENRRDLPWRRPTATAWGILVSEVMLQQTGVQRVLQPWQDWMVRWPTPDALAAGPASVAVAAWGRLGYPRRALRLHAAAREITIRHGGVVPSDLAGLRALPGVGEYTAAAVASFAYRQRHVVLDTNVRRLLARLDGGQELAAPAITAAERERAARYLPEDAERAAQWAAASMELGALTCTAARPGCDRCPVALLCSWRMDGHPAWVGPRRAVQRWQGTDRQCRGALLDAVRRAPQGVDRVLWIESWPDPEQAERSLAGLAADGLVRLDGVAVRL